MKLKKLLFILVMTVCTTACFAQNISKYYVTRPQDTGTIYFIMPMDMFEHKKNGTITMDFTKLAPRDTVTVNYTFNLPDILPANEVTFTYGESARSYPTTKIYVESAKKVWQHRYSVNIPYAEFKEIFSPQFSVVMTIAGDKTKAEYSSRDNQWRTNADIIRKITEVMDAND